MNCVNKAFKECLGVIGIRPVPTTQFGSRVSFGDDYPGFYSLSNLAMNKTTIFDGGKYNEYQQNNKRSV